MFNYDYTLEEGGVESSSETNQQVRVIRASFLFNLSTDLYVKVGCNLGLHDTHKYSIITKIIEFLCLMTSM